MPVTVASAERSFSKLKLIKNDLRSTMDQDRLVHLALISIEHAVARSTPFDEMLENVRKMGKHENKTCSNVIMCYLYI